MAEVELQQIGPYLITELLHTSSTGNYYRAKLRKKNILIKKLTISLSTPEEQEAFLNRAKQLKKLKNRNIVNVIDASFDGDSGYIAMEYVAGETMRQRFAAGELIAPDEIRRYLSPLAEALHYAHVNHTLHGNLHPGNLLLAQYNDILLTEFALKLPGSGKALDDEAQAIPYMAPEHLRGEPTFASDQYALAVMVYEWLCGRRPYEATERAELLHQQEHAAFPRPRSLNEAISPEVERVVVQALKYNPDERFPHTQAFADNYLSALMGFEARPATPLGVRAVPTFPPLKDVDKAGKVDQSMPAANNGKSVRQPLAPPQPIVPPTPAFSEDGVEKSIALEPSPSLPHWDEPSPTPSPLPADEKGPPVTPLTVSGFGESRLQAIVSTDLRQGGVLSHSLPGYEERPAQIEMAMLVARSITHAVPAIVEAGTGTGKSLAYLLPVVRSGKVAIVSTANKALQEQLFYKDIPFVQQHIKHFEAALVKGVNNYLCIDRMESERVGMQHYTRNREFKRLLDIVNDPDADFSGDFETLGFQLPSDIRGRVATDSDQCAWNKCSYFMDCYVRQMRERAEVAQVIVVNHTLLLLDAAIGGFLLPDRDVIILDEAHHLEEEATRSFTITISPAQIQTLLAQRMLKDHSLLSLQDEVLRTAQNMWIRLEQVANPGFKGRVNLEAPLEEGLRLATVISDLADSLRKQRPKNLEDKDSQLYDKLLKRTQNLSENVRVVFSAAQPDKFVYFVDRVESGSSRSGFALQASASPLDVTNWLKERLFDKCNVICTSATLATVSPGTPKTTERGANFNYFRRRIGLDPVERPDVLERILPLAFDYESNALLYLPRDLPEPTFGSGSDEYMKAIAREMYKLVKLSRGRAFLLFSSKRMLDRAYELMSPHLNFPLLKQGDASRLELTRRFRQEEGAILFGLKSFWEGVDIAGEALSLVVIDKLPFDPPDDPVHEARVALMKAAGENWFGAYVLPQAVLRLKQGLGRLLRTREDRGVMAILDTRLHTKGYGKLVINALPPARRTSSLHEVDRFFAQQQS
ncbi:MAG TPA: helicase C-terminal domain-containing protein [Ktedonosporobacter sp.]|nr:helicase C-terminal domain-containing protein [Ktedonosporobacter sp.]